MNYITQLNGFFNYLDKKITLTANAVSLYVMLLDINNKDNWIAEFSIKNSYFEDRTGLRRDKLNEARNLLKQKGLIKYQQADGSASGIYSIIEFGRDGKLVADTQSDTQSDTLPFNYNKPKPKPKRILADKPQSNKFIPPTIEEIVAYCNERKNNIDPQKFFDYFNASGWYDSKGQKVKSWKGKIITWEGGKNAGNSGYTGGVSGANAGGNQGRNVPKIPVTEF